MPENQLADLRRRLKDLQREIGEIGRREVPGDVGAIVGNAIDDATAKTTPVDADTMPLIDSAASNVLKKVTWANIKATLKTYFDTLYVALTGDQTVAGVKTFSGGTTKFDSGASGFPFLQFLQNAVSKAIIGISNGVGAIVAGTVSGDLAIRTVNQKIVISNNDGTTDHFTLSGTSQPEFRLNSVTTSSAITRYAINGTNKVLIGAAGTTNALITGTVAGDLAVRVASGQEILFSTDDGVTEHVTIYGDGNVWVTNNLSALSFSDRTPGYEGDALSALAGVRAKGGEIDHTTLPEFARSEDGGRDLGAMISMLTVAVQQLADKVEKLEKGKK